MSQNQLSMLRSQMTGQPMNFVQAPQAIFQTGQNIIPLANLGQNIYLSPQTIQQATQPQQQQVKEEN